jgi:hypothetical protein
MREYELMIRAGGREGADVLKKLVGAVSLSAADNTAEKKEDRDAVRAIVRANPTPALQLVALPHTTTGLSTDDAARILDEVIALVPDPVEAAALMNDNVAGDRLVELVQSGAGRPTVIAEVVDPKVILASIFSEYGDNDDDELEGMFRLRMWANQLKERDDWYEILQMEVAERTVAELLALSVYLTYFNFHEDMRVIEERAEEIEADVWDEVGLDLDEAVDLLRDLARRGMIPAVGREDVHKVRLSLGKAQVAAKPAPAPVDDEFDF